MKATLDLKTIQYINLFERLIGVKAKYCFEYNSTVIFIIPKPLMRTALGRNCLNVKKISGRLNKKVRFIVSPSSRNDIGKFVSDIVYPYRFKNLQLENDELTIFSILTTKAALIGRGKTRLNELADILENFFEIKKVIIR